MSGDGRVITNPERALWQAVLLQAAEEAMNGPKNVSALHRARVWQEARHYITTPSKDLAMVCALAGVEMEAVVERMRVQIDETGKQLPPPLGRQDGHVKTEVLTCH